MGGLVSLYASTSFTHYSLMFNAGLYFLIGASLVVFLNQGQQISITQAIFGTTFSCALTQPVVEGKDRRESLALEATSKTSSQRSHGTEAQAMAAKSSGSDL